MRMSTFQRYECIKSTQLLIPYNTDSIIPPHGAFREAPSIYLPASQSFREEKINETFWLLLYSFQTSSEKRILYISKPCKKEVEILPHLIYSMEMKDMHLARPAPLSRARSLMTSSITLSYSRTFAFPFAESINIQLSPANLSGSLITHYKSAYASIYIRKEHLVLGTLRSQMQ